MSDLLHVLSDFDVAPYSHLLHSLERSGTTVTDLLTLDPIEIAKRCPLPLLEVRRLVQDVIEACQKDAGIAIHNTSTSDEILASTNSKEVGASRHEEKRACIIKTLDPAIDAALEGGIYTGYITEIAGESAAGKTQLVISLLLSSQLPPPHGLERSAIYVSTEAPLNTSRLHQMLAAHPFYSALPPADRPSLDGILTIPVNDLEAQDHIIEFQLPVAVKRYNVGLIVIDSVAANYRAEHSTKNAEGLADRAAELAKLGAMLRRIATDENVAIVVTNQVSDRFDDPAGRAIQTQDLLRASSPAMSSSPAPTGHVNSRLDVKMSLDHQSRFFTGWGNERSLSYRPEDLKTPALGLAWTNQIAARIVLKLEGDRAVAPTLGGHLGGNIWHDRKRRRFLHVVFCPWAAPTEPGRPVEYEVRMEGIVSVVQSTEKENGVGSGEVVEKPEPGHQELLKEELWGFDGADDEEFP